MIKKSQGLAESLLRPAKRHAEHLSKTRYSALDHLDFANTMMFFEPRNKHNSSDQEGKVIMFSYQCEQTAKGEGCTKQGVCGKQPEVAALHDPRLAL
jgi:hypothetical protein